MKKTYSKIISIILCMILTLAITACNNKNISSNVNEKEVKSSKIDIIDTVDTADLIETIDVVNDTDMPESDSDITSKTEKPTKDEIKPKKKETTDIDSEKTSDIDSEKTANTEIDKNLDSNIDSDSDIDSEKDTVSESTNVSSLQTMVLSAESEEIQYEPEHREYDHYDKWIWVGDSRTVGMAGNIGITYLAKSAMGLDWFISVADELYNLEGYNIILNFGINDYWNVINYANFYNNLSDELFEKNKVFVMTVNPVDEIKQVGYGYSSSNSTIEWFNENLKNNLRNDIAFIDSYTYLTKTGFNTIDGIHYDGNTYIKIYNFMVDTITYSED